MINKLTQVAQYEKPQYKVSIVVSKGVYLAAVTSNATGKTYHAKGTLSEEAFRLAYAEAKRHEPYRF